MIGKQKLTPQQALQKIKPFCAYQERCHKEVKDKLYSFGLYSGEVNNIIATLIEENYLNEERFACHYAGGKFRMKQWGRKKIEYSLRQKGITGFNLKVAMKEIPEEEYLKVLEKLATAKWNSLKGEQYLNRMAKTTAYLAQKGFELPLISKVINNIRSGNKAEA